MSENKPATPRPWDNLLDERDGTWAPYQAWEAWVLKRLPEHVHEEFDDIDSILRVELYAACHDLVGWNNGRPWNGLRDEAEHGELCGYVAWETWLTETLPEYCRAPFEAVKMLVKACFYDVCCDLVDKEDQA